MVVQVLPNEVSNWTTLVIPLELCNVGQKVSTFNFQERGRNMAENEQFSIKPEDIVVLEDGTVQVLNPSLSEALRDASQNEEGGITVNAGGCITIGK
jgi:hypothetical protein